VLSSFVSDIQHFNSCTSKIVSGQTIDKKEAILMLPQTINSLKTIYKGTLNLKTDKKYQLYFNNLRLGINNNIDIYTNMMYVINNPMGKDVPYVMTNIKKQIILCNSHYSTIKLKNGDFKLPKNVNLFISSLNNYVESFVINSKQNEVVNITNSQYEDSIFNFWSSFNSIKTNLNYYAELARKNKISYDNAIGKAQQNLDSFNKLEQTFSKISVPEDNYEAFTEMNNILSMYGSYVNEFIIALNKENENIKNNNFDYNSIYTVSNKKYNDMINAIKNYDNKYNYYGDKK
jgi:hypothetical protein